eukprot:scaffold8227_cov119-Isochrysis_galbana.AAC.8
MNTPTPTPIYRFTRLTPIAIAPPLPPFPRRKGISPARTSAAQSLLFGRLFRAAPYLLPQGLLRSPPPACRSRR